MVEDSITIRKIKQDLQQWSDKLINIDFLPLEDAFLLLKQSLPYFPNIQFSYTSYPMTIYRARVISKDSQEDITNPKTFSYPPKEKAATYQRASVPGFPVFYGTMDAKTAMEELWANSVEPIKKGDQFYLSEWKIKQDVLCTFNCLTFSEITGEKHLIGEMTERVSYSLKAILANTPPKFREAQIYLYNKISQLFLTGKYLQSGPIAYKILFDSNPTDKAPDGILYPSCSNHYESINCAFHPDFVDQNMTMEIVRKMSFEEFTEQEAHSLVHYFGTIESDEVVWKNNKIEMYGKYKMTLDLSLKWPDEILENAQLFVRDKEIDLTKFCENLIDEIDFDAISIPQRYEDTTQPNKPLEFTFTYPLKDENCYFKNDEGINILNALRLTIPATRIINNALPDQVIKS
jgi:hypothetical protein